MTVKYYRDSEGNYLGAFSGSQPDNSIEVNSAPKNSNALWDGGQWVEPLVLKYRWEPRQFLKRFPLSVRAAVVTSSDPEVMIVYHELLAAQFVDINDPDTEAGLNLLISKGIPLTEQQKADLLTPETIG